MSRVSQLNTCQLGKGLDRTGEMKYQVKKRTCINPNINDIQLTCALHIILHGGFREFSLVSGSCGASTFSILFTPPPRMGFSTSSKSQIKSQGESTRTTQCVISLLCYRTLFEGKLFSTLRTSRRRHHNSLLCTLTRCWCCATDDDDDD